MALNFTPEELQSVLESDPDLVVAGDDLQEAELEAICTLVKAICRGMGVEVPPDHILPGIMAICHLSVVVGMLIERNRAVADVLPKEWS